MNNKKFKVQEGFNVAQTYVFSLLPNTALMGNLRGLRYYSGNFYGINDRSIYKVTPGNTVGTVLLTAISSIFAFGINSEGYIYVSTMSDMYKSSRSLGGTLTYFIATTSTSTFGTVQGIAFDSGNNMYIISNKAVCRINAGTSLVRIKSNGIGLSSGEYSQLSGIAIDINNNVYIVDRGKRTIYKMNPNGEAILHQIGSSTRTLRIDSTGSSAGFSDPTYITIDSINNIYVVDKSYIRKIDTTFKVTSYTDTTLIGITSLEGVATDPSNAVYCSKNGYIYTLKLACQAGYKLENNVCNICPKGTWSLAGSTQCTACTTGKTTPSTGSSNVSQCTDVSSTHYMNGTTLTLCPSNATCAGGPSGNGTPTFTCKAGYKKNAANNGCEECPIGSYGTNGTCTPCPTNRTTATTKSTLLSQCFALKGFFVTAANSTTTTAGTACPSNTTTPSTGATSSNDCSLVNAGYYMNGTTVTQCPSNTSCLGGPKTDTTTFRCIDGYETNAGACQKCGLGFYGTGGNCSGCPPNSTTSSIGRTSSNDCIALAGYFMSGGTLQSCPSNTTTTSSGSTSASQCTSASRGYYMSGGSAIPCPSNATCAGGTASFSCFAGYKKNGAGNGCEECDLGTWSASNASSCTPCPSNTTTSLTARTSSNQCTSAVRGYYMSNGTAISCPSNSSCEGGSASFLCSNGYETRGSACVSCGAGFYGTGGSCLSCSNIPATDSTATWTTRLAGQTSCVANSCKPNFKLNALSNNCDPCPDGTSGSNCTSASTGFYMSGGSVSRCPSNAYCDGGATPFVCSNGYETNGSSCVLCGVGFYGTGGRCVPCSSIPATDSTSTWTTRATGQTSCIADVCKPNFKLNVLTSNCEPCPSNTRGSNCTSASSGYYMSGTTSLLCPSNASCEGELASFVCSNNYIMNAESNACDPCPAGSEGLNCTTTLAGYYKNGSRSVICPSNASCEGGSNIFVCSNDYIMNAASNGCDTCPAGSKGLNCTTILPGYYNNGSRTLICPSNATCAGGSNSFVCDNGYMLNETGDGCVKCPDGKSGPNCTEILPGYYLRDDRVLACPSNGSCSGGGDFFTCSNGYFVNYRTGTCDVVTTIVQPGSSQLFNTRGSPTIADTTACLATGCTLLFKDPVTGEMLPRNPCISEGDYYDFATKKCINKCCIISMSNAKNDVKCKTDVTTTPAVRKPGRCPPRSANLCCRGNYIETNTTCKSYWNPGVDTWTAERNARCAAGFTDYGIDSISEKRRKYLAVA